jgi:hypothetical protein
MENVSMPAKRDDTKLIKKCIEFARDITAAEARFNATPESLTDPLVKSLYEVAEKQLHRADDRAARRLSKIVRTRATTIAGLCAKARIASVVSELHVEEANEYDAEETLLESLGADVLALFDDEGKTASAASVVEARQ